MESKGSGNGVREERRYPKIVRSLGAACIEYSLLATMLSGSLGFAGLGKEESVRRKALWPSRILTLLPVMAAEGRKE
jgi:hypothetical protein